MILLLVVVLAVLVLALGHAVFTYGRDWSRGPSHPSRGGR